MSGDGARTRRRPRLDRWTRGPDAAARRLAGGMVIPEIKAGFRLDPQARIFCAGACFARPLEAALARAGAQVASLPEPGDPSEIRTNARHGLCLQATPHLLKQELDWAGGTAFPEDALLPVADRWSDPFLGAQAAEGTLAEIRARRRGIARYFARARRSGLVMLVLGDVETWFDRRTRMALAGPPHATARAADRDRFGMKRLRPDEAETTLRTTCEALRRTAPGVKVVLVVSPVPIERTWTSDDVIVANAVSKSTLHAAAASVAGRLEGVDYFPGYEAIMAADTSEVWEADRRTVRTEAVDGIAAAFMARYGVALGPESRTLGQA